MQLKFLHILEPLKFGTLVKNIRILVIIEANVVAITVKTQPNVLHISR